MFSGFGGPCFSHLENFWELVTGLPLLKEHRVQARLIFFNLVSIPSPEMQVRVQVLPAVVDMGVKGPIPAHVSPSLATWLLVPPCYQLNLESCLRSYKLSDNSWPLGEVECCFPSCSLCRGQGDLEGSALYPAWSGLGRKATQDCLGLF